MVTIYAKTVTEMIIYNLNSVISFCYFSKFQMLSVVTPYIVDVYLLYQLDVHGNNSHNIKSVK